MIYTPAGQGLGLCHNLGLDISGVPEILTNGTRVLEATILGQTDTWTQDFKFYAAQDDILLINATDFRTDNTTSWNNPNWDMYIDCQIRNLLGQTLFETTDGSTTWYYAEEAQAYRDQKYGESYEGTPIPNTGGWGAFCAPYTGWYLIKFKYSNYWQNSGVSLPLNIRIAKAKKVLVGTPTEFTVPATYTVYNNSGNPFTLGGRGAFVFEIENGHQYQIDIEDFRISGNTNASIAPKSIHTYPWDAFPSLILNDQVSGSDVHLSPMYLHDHIQANLSAFWNSQWNPIPQEALFPFITYDATYGGTADTYIGTETRSILITDLGPILPV